MSLSNPEEDEVQLKKNKDFKQVIASEKDISWQQDPKSYITIMPYPKKGKIMVRVYATNNEKLFLIEGETPQQIYYKMINMNLITRLDHAAYIGKELQKAYIALKQGLYYNQDDLLDFNKKIKKE